MEKPQYRIIKIICFIVILLGVTAFACSLAAEFKKLKVMDMKVDGSMCYLPRSPAFGLGIAALVCLSVAQIIGTTVAATRLCTGDKKSRRSRMLPITFLVLSWLSFGLSAILLGTGSSMNNKQPYGKGWTKGECYVVKDGVYAGSAVLVAATIIFIIAFIFTTTTERICLQTGPDEERNQRNDQQQKQADSGRR